jgi:hypothetical protein
MATYWCAFRLAADKAYRTRYEAVSQALFSLRTKGAGAWTEAAPFYAFQSELGLDDVAKRLAAAIDPDRDLIVVGVLGGPATAYCGPLQHPETFAAMFPEAKNLA